MTATGLDAAGFRQGQQQQWDKAATGWRRWAPVLDSSTRHISQRLVELSEAPEGGRVLDIACGYGEPALTAARRVGPAGQVVATDISAEMISYGRERAQQADLTNVEFVQREAAALDFPAASFDAALSRWGLIFEPDAEATAARVRAMLKPGARIAVASWGTPEQVPMLGVPMRVAAQRLQVPPPPPGTPGPLSRPTADSLGGLLAAGGFSDVDVVTDDVTLEWDSPDRFVEFVRDIAPPVTALLAPHPPEVQAETWKAIADAVADLAGPGPVRLSNTALLAVGRA